MAHVFPSFYIDLITHRFDQHVQVPVRTVCRNYLPISVDVNPHTFQKSCPLHPFIGSVGTEELGECCKHRIIFIVDCWIENPMLIPFKNIDIFWLVHTLYILWDSPRTALTRYSREVARHCRPEAPGLDLRIEWWCFHHRNPVKHHRNYQENHGKTIGKWWFNGI